MTSIEALATGSGEIVSRYGGSVPILAPTPANIAGFELVEARLGLPQSGFRPMSLFLAGDLPPDVDIGNGTTVPLSPIVTVNDKAVPLPYTLVGKRLDANVPDTLLNDGGG